ncbi:MAG: hypothetical protein BWY59_00735 [Verrucomicrobia bacterium ADurb.Bin345]|nr:MAG: hypothetical protein BWY59_00735 [Verrucomicrobia bacterium ADurb.Bin345]
MVADRAQAARKPVQVDFPCAGVRPSGLVVIPAGVHPPVVKLDAALEILVDKKDLVLRVGVDHLPELVGTARSQLRHGRKRPARPRQIVRDHPRAPHVLRVLAVALPELHDHHRRAHFLPRKQFEMRQFLAGAHAQPVAFVPRELRRPLARPAHHENQALVAGRDVEIGKLNLRRPSAHARDAPVRLRSKSLVDRLETVGGAIVALVPVQHVFVLRVPFERRVNGLNAAQNRRVGRAGILEMERPLHRRIVRILHPFAPNHQPRFGIRVGERVARPPRVKPRRRALQGPPGKKLGGFSPTVGKREKWLHGVGRTLRTQLRHVAQPDRRPVLENHPRIGPVGLVAGYPVSPIAHGEHEFRSVAQIDRYRHARHSLAHELRMPDLGPAGFHAEHHAAPAAAGLLIRVHPHDCLKPLPRLGKIHHDAAHGVTVQPPAVLHVRDPQRTPPAGVHLDRVVVRHHLDARAQRGGFRLPLEPCRRPPARFVQFQGIRHGRCRHVCRKCDQEKSRHCTIPLTASSGGPVSALRPCPPSPLSARSSGIRTRVRTRVRNLPDPASVVNSDTAVQPMNRVRTHCP